MTDEELITIAKKTQIKGLGKHTGFRVGAALLAKSGKVYTGINIESDIPSLSNCADRIALFAALTAGEREFEKIAIVTEAKIPTPCGACRQMLFEFCGSDLLILGATPEGKKLTIPLSKLLPNPYRMER